MKKSRYTDEQIAFALKQAETAAGAPNEMWSMDSVSDALFDGRRLRALTVVDASDDTKHRRARSC